MLKGIDTSQHQGSVDEQKMRAAGVDFRIVKSTEGADFTDPRFSELLIERIRKQHMRVGVYHFLRPQPGRSGDVEIRHAVRRAKAAGWGKPGDLRLAIDIEVTDLSTAATAIYFVQAVKEYKRLMGHAPLVYSFPFFLQGLRLKTTMNCPLWIAHFGAKTPTIPMPWKHDEIWQKSSSASVGGESPVDLNEAIASEFKAALIPEVDKPPPPPPPPPKLSRRQKLRRRVRRARRKYLRNRHNRTLRTYLVLKARLGIFDRRYFSYWGLDDPDERVTPTLNKIATKAYGMGLVPTSTTGGAHADGSYHKQRDSQGRGKGLDIGNRRELVGTAKGMARMLKLQRWAHSRWRKLGLAELLGPDNSLAVLRSTETNLSEGTSLEEMHDTHVHFGDPS